MKRLIFLQFLLLTSALVLSGKEKQLKKEVNPVDFSQVKISDSFWTPRMQSHKNVTLAVCIDQIENQTGRMRNFENAAKGRGKHSGIFFDDSDVYKALEGMAYSLVNNPDPKLEAKCDEWIDKFAAAQQPDGYLNTYYTLTGLENRWTDMSYHEMYCFGHMSEAAVAYFKATGKRKFLDVACRMADYMMTVFGPGKRDWVPGHEEVELALVKLSLATGQKKYLDFAGWLLNERGHGLGGRYSADSLIRWDPRYNQDDVPVSEITNISGHAVRAMYLYCGMADVAALTGNSEYIEALNRVWDDVVNRNMYITGGIGSSASNEGFTQDYDLPNAEAYCETCASVGMILWNWRMNQLTGDSKYVDVLERDLYNGALAGISLKGDRFFYVNPLESDGNHHRQAWYGCACCPSQICRFIPSIGNYIYGTSNNALWVNLFIGSKASVGKDVTLSQETDYPWGGNVKITVGSVRKVRKQIRIRIPDWCHEWSISVNGAGVKPKMDRGYAVLEGPWKNQDEISVSFGMKPEMVAADPKVKQDVGKRAVRRGPVVYCVEETDNRGGFGDIKLSSSTMFESTFDKDLLGGVETVSARTDGGTVRFIPYYAWDNREPGRMEVWLDFAGM